MHGPRHVTVVKPWPCTKKKKKKEISSVPAADHGIGLLAERQAMATGS